MGLGRVRLQRHIRYVHARHHRWHAAAGERRQVRVRVPHESEVERLRLHRVRKAVNQYQQPERDGLRECRIESDERDADAPLLSPWPESVFAYEPVWSRLAEQTPLDAISLPGFGSSEARRALWCRRA